MLGIPSDRGGRIGLLVIALVVALLVLAGGLRRRDPLLRFDREAGAVLVRAGALEDAIRAQVAARCRRAACLAARRLHGQRLTAEVEVVARPLADKERLRALTESGARAAITSDAGLPEVRP